MAAGPDGIRDPAPNKPAASRAIDPTRFSGSSVRPIVISFSTFTLQRPAARGVAGFCRSPAPRVIVPRAGGTGLLASPRSDGVSCSITAEATWRLDRLVPGLDPGIGQIEIANRLQGPGGEIGRGHV